MVRYATVCSGIDAPAVAWDFPRWEQVFGSEIEAFPSAVMAHHNPEVPNYGDMTKYKEWPNANIDVLIGGTPCQSFSIAGLRKGLDDPRGNLALTFIGLVDRYRPRWVVWENVPGVLSSGGGRDFGSFIDGMAEIGYFGAWRVLDAQWFGVAQRRRRVFAIFCPGDWRPAAAVLFEPESLRGDPAPSREAGERIAPSVSCGPPFSRTGNERVEAEAMVPEVANPLTARMHKGINTTADEGQTPIPIAFNWQNGGGYGKANDGLGMSIDHTPPQSTSQVAAVAIHENQKGELREQDTVALNSGGGKPGQGYPCVIAPSLTASNDPSRSPQSSEVTQQVEAVYGASMAVRRLTPVECERLQGFPDGYTAIPWRGKPADQCPDGPRYKALGNSMAVPVVRWIGERIQIFDTL